MSSSWASASIAPRSLPSSRRAGAPVLTAASSAEKSAGIVVSAIRPPTTLRARSGWISSRRDARLSTTKTSSSESRTCRRATGRAGGGRRAARATSGVVTTSTFVGDLGAHGAGLGDRGAEIDHGQRVARLHRGQHAARHGGVDLLGALALVGREQHAHAERVRVERLLQVAHRELPGDVDEIDDAAPVRRVQQRPEVALLQVEVDDADRPPGRAARGGERQVQRDRGRADAALGARHGDELAAEHAGRGLLAGHPVAQRARPHRAGAHAGLELLERERQRRATSRTPACIAARSSSGESSAAISTTPTSGKLGRQLARQLDRRDAAQLVVQHDDVEVQPPQRARQVLRIGDAVDDLELLPSAASAAALEASASSPIARRRRWLMACG